MSGQRETKTLMVAWDVVSREDLTDEEYNELCEAEGARSGAHAPYSGFKVGAAIRTNDGEIFNGQNIENIVYAALHAEEAAIGKIDKKSRESGIYRVTTIGGPADSLDSADPVLPCGLCRQKLLEFVRPGDNPEVIAAGIKGAVIRIALRDLLPLGFFPAEIKK